MDNDRPNILKQIVKPVDFNSVRQRMQVVDFVPFYGLTKHAERLDRNPDYSFIDYIDDGIILGAYNVPFAVAGLYIADSVWSAVRNVLL